MVSVMVDDANTAKITLFFLGKLMHFVVIFCDRLKNNVIKVIK